MHTRSPMLQSFLDSFEAAIVAAAPLPGPAAHAATKIFGALRTPAAQTPNTPVPSVVEHHLWPALETARAGAAPVAKVTDAFAELEPSLTWAQRRGAESDPEFAAGHSNATISGPTGIEKRGDVWIGVSLMAPGTRYPDHQHPPEEVYLVLSPGEWRRGGGAWFEPGVGGIVYNPPNIVHAMRSKAAPLLALWCLWLGD